MKGRRITLRPGRPAIAQEIRDATQNEIIKTISGGRIEETGIPTPQQIRKALEGTSTERLKRKASPTPN